MELLIRSQDKKQLLKVNDGLYIANGFTDTDDSFIGIKNVGNVGRYKTEERALEILDEIQNILKSTIKINYEYDDSFPIMNGEWLKSVKRESKIEELSTYVYEMPKE